MRPLELYFLRKICWHCTFVNQNQEKCIFTWEARIINSTRISFLLVFDWVSLFFISVVSLISATKIVGKRGGYFNKHFIVFFLLASSLRKLNMYLRMLWLRKIAVLNTYKPLKAFRDKKIIIVLGFPPLKWPLAWYTRTY